MAATHHGQTNDAATTAAISRPSSIITRTGPGVGTTIWFLSPGVLKTAGTATSTNTIGTATQRLPVSEAAAHGPATHATISIKNRVADDAAVS